ncbi:MAG: CBS domain-containing protein [Actinobacteria bacterium]|nr:CBS domain-containing protein [Actinomycetota bacterium]
MIYLSQMLDRPVVDSTGEEIGTISDLAISTGEVFPRITSLAFKGPAKTPFMVSWRKYVEDFDGERIKLKVESHEIRFSYLQPDEILLSRDLLNKQIVDTQGLKVVRVNDLKFSVSSNQLRLLGAEVGARGILRGLSPRLETTVLGITKALKHPLSENIIAWNYMDLLDRDLSQVKLSVTHKRLHELHPADVADILEQLDPQQRASVFEHLDNAQAAETISELEEEFQSDVIDDLSEARASTLLAQMDPDDAADIIGDLPYEKAETLLRLMGVKEERAIRALLGYKEKTAGGIMTTEFFSVPEETTVGETIEKLRNLPEDHEAVQYVYTITEGRKLTGVLSMRTLVLANNNAVVGDLAFRDLITALPDDDQEEVADAISKYSILAMPVIDEEGKLLGIVTVDDALDVIEEEHNEDLAIAGAARREATDSEILGFFKWFLQREFWFIAWIVTAALISFFGKLDFFVGTLIVMPLVLIIASDVCSYAINKLIEHDGDEELSFSKLLGRDILVGFLIAGFCGLLLAAFLGVTDSHTTNTILISLSNTLLPATITVFLVVVSSAVLSAFAKWQHDKGNLVSYFGLNVSTMLFALILQIALATAFSTL